MSTRDDLTIRPVRDDDRDALWPILRDVIRPGDTYAIDPAVSREDMLHLWCDMPAASYVAERDGVILGTYYIKTNQQGGGSHVCNCGYITAPAAQGQGIARAMCEHSQDAARALGYEAMQFNFVVASNVGAIALWTKLGFETVGRLPRAFRHPEQGLMDALVMFKWLGD
ncbi:MAG: GNAT family N-acetyltransferase [Pseudomonadota bacterium]